MMRVSGRRRSLRPLRPNGFGELPILTAAGAIGAASQAEAALYYWSDSDPGYFAARTDGSAAAAKDPPPTGKKIVAPEKETGAKPQGPLIISISIDKQKVQDLRRQRILRGNARFPRACPATRRRWASSASSRNTSCTIPTSIAARRCPTCSGSPGRASPCMPACCRAIRLRMAASACRWRLP